MLIPIPAENVVLGLIPLTFNCDFLKPATIEEIFADPPESYSYKFLSQKELLAALARHGAHLDTVPNGKRDQIHFVTFVDERGLPSEVIDERLQAAGIKAVRYRIDAPTETLVPVGDQREPITNDVEARAYMRDGLMARICFVHSVRYEGEREVNGERVSVIRHSPRPIHVIIVPVSQVPNSVQNVERFLDELSIEVGLDLDPSFCSSDFDLSRGIPFPTISGAKNVDLTLFDGRIIDARKYDGDRPAYLRAIDALEPGASDTEINKAVDMILDANLSVMPLADAKKALAKALDISSANVSDGIKQRKRKRDNETAKKGRIEKDPKGQIIYRYHFKADFEELCEIGVLALKEKKHPSGAPMFCQIDGKAVRMDLTGDGRVRCSCLSQTDLWSELNKLVSLVQRTEAGDGPREPFDEKAAKHIHAQAYKLLPRAPEVIYTPIFLADGSLMNKPGFHKAHNLLLVQNGLVVPPVSEAPTQEEAQASLDWLKLELLSDFPFYELDQDGNVLEDPSRASALSMIITPFMRRKINGRTPCYFITKPQPQTGGTLLASIPIRLFDGLGVKGGSLPYTTNEEEMQKLMVAESMNGRSHLFFDDVVDFNNRVIIRGLTQDHISGRELGHSRTVSVANNFNWIATGNNTDIGEEMRRRISWIRLNAEEPDLNTRKFRHPDVSGKDFAQFLTDNRGLAIHHVLTLIKYWQNLGCPEFGVETPSSAEDGNKKVGKPLASFEDWSKKVGGVLQAVGVKGFLESRAPIVINAEQAEEAEFLREFTKKFQTEPQILKNVFDWSEDMGFGIVDGKDTKQQRANLARTLRRFDGRAFKCGGQTYLFGVSQDRDGGILFGVKLKPARKGS